MSKIHQAVAFLSRYAGFLIVAGAVIVAGVLFLKNAETVRAGSVYLGTATVIDPKPPTVESYEASSRMEFNARYNFVYCGNTLPTARGKITQPVPVDQPHTVFGPERLSSLTLATRTGSDQRQYQYRFSSTYAQDFTAPATPGLYKFRYVLGTRNGQNTDAFFSGEVRFLVRARDICTNIDGVQTVAPAGNYATTNASGQAVCLDEGSTDLICTVAESPIIMGNTANFTARMRNNAQGTFSWFLGQMTAGSPIKIDTNVLRSNFSRVYDQPGVYQVTSIFTGAGGRREECVVGVTVYPDAATDALSDPGDGALGFLDPNAPPAVVDLTLANALTNTTCLASWNAQNVLGCQLYRAGEVFRDVDATGSLELTPGSYQLKCVQLKDGATVSSELAVCRKNIDTREI